MAEVKHDEKFVDPNTGETVTRIKVPEALVGDIQKYVDLNGLSANNFMQLSRQIIMFQKRQLEEFDKAANAEKEIGVGVIKTREKMGLDSAWVFNIPLRMMERREPPSESKLI